jgi:hypothetical protein
MHHPGMIDAQARDRVEAMLIDGERIEVEVAAESASIVVTDRRILVFDGPSLAMDCPIRRLRRIQLDVERGVPASMAVVPEDLAIVPQILRLEDDSLADAASAVALVGRRLG